MSETIKPLTDERIVNAISCIISRGLILSLNGVKFLIENEITKQYLIFENTRLRDERDKLRKDNLRYLSEKNTHLREEVTFLKKR